MVAPLGASARRGLAAAAAGALAVAGAVVLAFGWGHGGPPAPGADAALVDAGFGPDHGPGSAGATGTRTGPTSVPGEPARPAGPGEPAAAEPAADFGTVLPASDPVTVAIPAIGLAATALVPLEIGDDGVLAAPTDYAAPGWHVAGPDPGQLGPAVLAGHVDGPDGPAVFYRLGELLPGDLVEVARADGTVATFSVDQVASYAKADFPTSAVYGLGEARSEIRLITCGGAFDRATGHYVDNVVVFGHLVR